MEIWLLLGALGLMLALGLILFGLNRQGRAGNGATASIPAQVARDEGEFTPLFTALAELLEDGLLVLGPDRRIRFANKTAGRILGTPTATLLDKTLMAGIRDHRADETVEQALASGEVQSTTLRHPRSGRTLRLSCEPLADQQRHAVVLLRDLTQVTQLERARRELVANVSHELRTPLASVRLLVETLAREPPPPVARRMLGQIDDELVAMTQLIDELRELSHIESGRLMLRQHATSIPDLAERTMERLRPQMERHKLTLTGEFAPDLPAALIDEERIGQALINLLHNALKWTPEGGVITVRACRAMAEDDERTARELEQVEGSSFIKLSVHDTGIGIPGEETGRVFERFYKVDRARTRDSGGSGLGLAIVKHIVERHGGRIWVESREGQGSVFSMLLPAE